MTKWQYLIDWEKNFSDADGIDDITGDVISATWKLGMSKPFQVVADESTAEFRVRNDEGKYNPENSTSVLYPYLLPQRPVHILADGATMWRGWIKEIQPDWSPDGLATGKTTAIIRCIGAKQYLQDAQVILPLQQNKRGNEIIAVVLRQIVLPPALVGNVWILGRVGFSELGVTTRLADEDSFSDLETGVLVFGYYGDSQGEKKRDAFTVIKEITEAERGRFFFDRDGKAVWWNQNHIPDDVIDDYAVDEDGIIGIRPHKIDYKFGTDVSNRIEVKVYPRSLSGSEIVLWKLDYEIEFTGAETKEFEAPYVDASDQPCGATEVSTDNIVWGSGTGSVVLSPNADRALVTVNSTGAATLTGLEIVGKPITTHNQMVARVDDSSSIVIYGVREHKLDLKALEDYNEGLDTAQYELTRRKLARGIVSKISFLNEADGQSNAEQLGWRIGDRLRIKLDGISHNSSYFIMGEQHTIEDGGKSHATTFFTEPSVADRLANYDDANADSNIRLKYDSDKVVLAQSFKPSDSRFVGRVRLWLNRVGSPTGDLTIKICENTPQGGTWYLGRVGASELGTNTVLAMAADYPGATIVNGTSEVVNAATLDVSYQWIEFQLPAPPYVSAGVSYWLVLETTDGISTSNYAQWGADGSSPTYADGVMMYQENGGSWKVENKDAAFEVYAI